MYVEMCVFSNLVSNCPQYTIAQQTTHQWLNLLFSHWIYHRYNIYFHHKPLRLDPIELIANPEDGNEFYWDI